MEVWPVGRDLGIHEHSSLGGSEGGEGETLPLDAEHRGPGGDTASALGLIIGPGRLGSLASIWGPGDWDTAQLVSREDPGAAALSSCASHTPRQRCPHNYINRTSSKMLISPLTYFRLGAIVPTSLTRLRGLAHDSPTPSR